MAHVLSAEDLLAGGTTSHTLDIPASLVAPSVADQGEEPSGIREAAGTVTLRPLLVRDVDRVVRAAKEQRVLTSVLMVQQALVSPPLSVEQVSSLPAGLVEFLADKVNALSGLGLASEDLERLVKAPLAKACFVLAREFGWTPSECSELTVGQVLLYLEMLARDERSPASPEVAA